MTKRKFSKLLNKEVTYTAIKTQKSAPKAENPRVLLTDIKHKGKLYADHAWVIDIDTLNRIPIGSEIEFKATAYMYNDKFDVRKQGLKWCHHYYKLHEEYHKDKATEDLNQMRKRISKR
ncbi:MAG: hypothetical protein J7L15_04555 [Clostridiales bacterium]|nr:hypothetical protein [Clostridiales bacterium]